MARRQNSPLLQGAQATLVALCGFSLVLALVDSRGGITDQVRTVTGAFMGPVQSGIANVARPLSSFLSDWAQLGSRKERIEELQSANDELRARLQLTEDGTRRVAELDAVLRVAGMAQFKILPAQVIAIGSAAGFANTVLIDAGSIDGVRVDMNVISGAGLIGRVVQVWKRQASIALITDPSSTVGARVEGSGQIGFVSGLGRSNALQLQLLDPYAPLKVGDRLVSFGVAHGIYGTGFPVGTVTSIRGKAGTATRLAEVEPFVAMGALDLVSVVVAKPRQDPRDSLLPAPPSPSAAASVTETATSDAATPTKAGPTTSGVTP
jgi:rod shape-determining protein MreC